MFPGPLSIIESDIMASLAAMVLGTYTRLKPNIFVDPALSSSSTMPIYYLQEDQCKENSSFCFDFSRGASKSNLTQDQEVRCAQGLCLWRNSSSGINGELYKDYQRGNTEERTNEVAVAFDSLNSNENIFNVSIWYNLTYKCEDGNGFGPIKMTRVPHSVNMMLKLARKNLEEDQQHQPYLPAGGATIQAAGFGTQANALLRKNLTFQKRNRSANCRLVLFPALLLLLLFFLQAMLEASAKMNSKKGEADVCTRCVCPNNEKVCEASEKLCGPQYLLPRDVSRCAIRKPPEWIPLLQIPSPEARAVRTTLLPFPDLPDPSCRQNANCPVTLLYTADNQPFGEVVFGNMFPSRQTTNDDMILGTEAPLGKNIFVDSAFRSSSNKTLYYLQKDACEENSTLTINLNKKVPDSNLTKDLEVKCVQGLTLWRNSAAVINDELFKGYYGGNKENQTNEIVAAYDLLNSNKNIFNVSIWYNTTYKGIEDPDDPLASMDESSNMIRVSRLVNMISNAYLQLLRGPGTMMSLEFLKEMPKSRSASGVDLASALSGLFFTWIVLQLFPVVLTSLVYEKQQNLRIMMKMHGLSDGPYWMISYCYFLAISTVYMECFVIIGSILRFKFFTVNDYSIQFVFYFIYINLQISIAFLGAGLFSSVKTATVTGYLFVFGTGLVANFLFVNFIEQESFPRGWITFMELFPGFALYRGVYEFRHYAQLVVYRGGKGMRWGDLSDKDNGMKEILIIMLAEWILCLVAGYYVDQVFTSGKSPLFFLIGSQKKQPSLDSASIKRQGSNASAEMEKSDIIQEREKVGQFLIEPTINHAMVCDNLRKVYPGRDGNPEKVAVKGMFLAVPQGECLGLLGPNGAGKTSFISMMTGLSRPTYGTAYIQGMDLRTHMDGIYTTMGICPQYDLLWETLTGREHLLFYGRLKNLKGALLTKAIEDSLTSLNLFHGGVADKQVGQYSGGMKRRLSVAISLIGNPSVVYLDEPSTGLDPASRSRLWNVIKNAKRDRAIILTTHSMEEAEALCDRLGIFVSGALQCIGNAKELKGRYGGTYVFTMTTSSDHEEEVEKIVQKLSPNANKIYHLSGTQKYELPKADVRIADVFRAVEFAKRNFTVSAWGLADTTMEDVFIKVAGAPRS